MNILDIAKGYSYNNDKIVKVGKHKIYVKTHLVADDYASCVHLIVDSCFIDEEYKPEFKEIAKRYAYLKYFTDIDISGETAETIYYYSQADWFEEIYKAISDLSVFVDIEEAVERLIEYKLSLRKTSFDILCDSVSSILNTDNTRDIADIKAILDGINKVDKAKFISAVLKKERKGKSK